MIIDAAKRMMTPDKARLVQDRSAKHAVANQRAHVEAVKQAVELKRAGWNGSPIATARIYAELWPLIMERGLVPFLAYVLFRRPQCAVVGSHETV